MSTEMSVDIAVDIAVENFDTVLSDSTPENFANIWQIKWNWKGLMKFETVRIHFL